MHFMHSINNDNLQFYCISATTQLSTSLDLPLKSILKAGLLTKCKDLGGEVVDRTYILLGTS